MGRHAGAGHKIGMQVVRKAVEADQDVLVAAHERVVANTAGMATARPSAVMMRASPMGPTTLSMVDWPEVPMASSAW